mmetsp:Transcript_23497/g.72560  ORF Transcript_23497/g.72560 Transcript_23497/m.72560 type:complete len:108 (+) Transcript_23497:307-630(+)
MLQNERRIVITIRILLIPTAMVRCTLLLVSVGMPRDSSTMSFVAKRLVCVSVKLDPEEDGALLRDASTMPMLSSGRQVIDHARYPSTMRLVHKYSSRLRKAKWKWIS